MILFLVFVNLILVHSDIYFADTDSKSTNISSFDLNLLQLVKIAVKLNNISIPLNDSKIYYNETHGNIGTEECISSVEDSNIHVEYVYQCFLL